MIEFGSKDYMEKLIAHAEGYASAYCKPRDFVRREVELAVWSGVRAGYIQAGQDLHDKVIGKIKEPEQLPGLYEIYCIIERNKELEALIEAKDAALKSLGVYRRGLGLMVGDERLYLVGKTARVAHALTPDALKQKIAARDAVIDAARKWRDYWSNSGIQPSAVDGDLWNAIDALKQSEK